MKDNDFDYRVICHAIIRSSWQLYQCAQALTTTQSYSACKKVNKQICKSPLSTEATING